MDHFVACIKTLSILTNANYLCKSFEHTLSDINWSGKIVVGKNFSLDKSIVTMSKFGQFCPTTNVFEVFLVEKNKDSTETFLLEALVEI